MQSQVAHEGMESKEYCMRCASATSMCTYFAEVGRKRLHFVPGMQVEVGQPRYAELLAQVHHLLRVSVDLLAHRPGSNR